MCSRLSSIQILLKSTNDKGLFFRYKVNNINAITYRNYFYRILTEIANSNNIPLKLKEFRNFFKKIGLFYFLV